MYFQSYIVTGIIFCLNLSGVASAPDSASYSYEQMLSDNDKYLSSIKGITFADSAHIILTGIKTKEKIINGALVSEIINNTKTDSIPRCMISHTEEEYDSYVSFHNSFVTRPKGSDGSRMVVNWNNAIIYQDVKLSVNRNTIFAQNLFNADLALKRIVLGKLRSRIFKVPSFAGFTESKVKSGLDNKSRDDQSKYETIFILKPDTIIVKKEHDRIEIIHLSFALEPSDSGRGDTSFEKLWADQFNSSASKILEKNKDLRKMTEIFKAYFLIKQFAYNIPAVSGNSFPNNDIVPEKIRAIKYYAYVESLDPLINEPGRSWFVWMMLSGGVSFDFSRAVIIER
jgi:hypothetical protein